jgi:hypothetical protein
MRLDSGTASGGGADPNLANHGPRACDLEHVIVQVTGRHGIWHNGPTDCNIVNVVVLDAGQSDDNTYYGYFGATGATGAHLWNFHGWSRQYDGIVNHPAYQGYFTNQAFVANSAFESARASVYSSGGTSFSQVSLYAYLGAAGGALMTLTGQNSIVTTSVFTCGDYVNGLPYAVQLGTAPVASRNQELTANRYNGCTAGNVHIVNDIGSTTH